jgi:hypothetical protein
MRCLLPHGRTGARAPADGTLGAIGFGAHGLSRVDWRSWPAEQVAASEAFLRAWWQDALATPEPPYGIDEIFDTCVTIGRTVTPCLEGWIPGPVADAHLAHCADVRLYDLLSDDSPFSRWYDDTVDAGVTDLRAWLSDQGAVRLHAAGEYDLAIRAELLGLPHHERWDHHP